MITDRLEIQNVFVGDAGACKIEYSIGCHKYSATHGSLAEAIKCLVRVCELSAGDETAQNEAI